MSTISIRLPCVRISLLRVGSQRFSPPSAPPFAPPFASLVAPPFSLPLLCAPSCLLLCARLALFLGLVVAHPPLLVCLSIVPVPRLAEHESIFPMSHRMSQKDDRKHRTPSKNRDHSVCLTAILTPTATATVLPAVLMFGWYSKSLKLAPQC